MRKILPHALALLCLYLTTSFALFLGLQVEPVYGNIGLFVAALLLGLYIYLGFVRKRLKPLLWVLVALVVVQVAILAGFALSTPPASSRRIEAEPNGASSAHSSNTRLQITGHGCPHAGKDASCGDSQPSSLLLTSVSTNAQTLFLRGGVKRCTVTSVPGTSISIPRSV